MLKVKVYNLTISDKGLLEPIVMKVTRWVLRREGGGDSSDLSHGWFKWIPSQESSTKKISITKQKINNLSISKIGDEIFKEFKRLNFFKFS